MPHQNCGTGCLRSDADDRSWNREGGGGDSFFASAVGTPLGSREHPA